MSSCEHPARPEQALIERLLADPRFRREFRRDPVRACRQGGFAELAQPFTPGASMHTLELRESKSSLAGLIIALAAEGIGLAELEGLFGHGPRGSIAAANPALPGEVRLGGGAAVGHAEAPPPSALVGHAPAPSVAPGPPAPTAPRHAPDLPASAAAPAPEPAVVLLTNSNLSLPPSVRAAFEHGAVDPRLVSVLQTAAETHRIVIGDFETVSRPVHVQVVNIVSVDGKPVAPDNIAARDLVGELAALQPGERPTEVASPWAIGSQGFVTGEGLQHRLQLTFVSAPEPSGYVDPLPTDAQIGRTDMGVDVDLRPGEPIVAPGRSRVLGVVPNWYDHQPYVALQFLSGPMNGRNYYIAEQIDLAVRPGQIVAQGEVIARYAASGSGIEMGWAGDNWQQTLAQAVGNTGDATHANAPAGVSFRHFLDALRNRSASSVPMAAGTDSAGAAAADTAAAPVRPGVAPVRPATAGFVAVTHRRPRSFQRQTVQIQAFGSPSSGEPGGGHGAGVAHVEAVASAALAASGGTITVRSPFLTSGQEEFAARLAELTGLDPRVISAWELAEQSGPAARHYQAGGYFNWLNVGQFDSGPSQIALSRAFGDPVTAAEQTAKFLRGTWGGASASIRAILATAGEGPQQQIDAIANSDWASSHYGGGANLRGTYDELADIVITGS